MTNLVMRGDGTVSGRIVMSRFPVQIQADSTNAEDSMADCMVHVFDHRSEIRAVTALAKSYLHVVAWDSAGDRVYLYDNR